jgi:hypothetical protein
MAPREGGSGLGSGPPSECAPAPKIQQRPSPMYGCGNEGSPNWTAGLPRGCIPPQMKPTGGLGMKQLILAGALALAATGAQDQYYGTGSNSSSHTSSGYTTSRGAYVKPYVATNPNSTQRDNFSATGNVNPYTGAVGTRTPRH